MPRYVTFLRGINLGGRRVKMAELRAPFEAMGLDGVATYLASGNVVFDAPEGEPAPLEEAIEDRLEEALGFASQALVRTMPELERLVGHWIVEGAEDDFKPYVVFLRDEAGEDVRAALDALQTPDDRLHPLGREVVWLRRGGIGDTPISPGDFEKAVDGTPHTRRTLNTVRRIVEKFGG